MTIAAVFGVMAATQHLTFQVLTKRAERLPRWFAWLAAQQEHDGPWGVILRALAVAIGPVAAERWISDQGFDECESWPLQNVHIGVTVEDQRRADERIPHLLAIPAAVRWLSVEPMLEAIDLRDWTPIDWVVVGGESGRRARPFALEWADDVRRLCARACFMKQAGSNAYVENLNYWPDAWASTVRQRPAPDGVTAAGAVGLRLRHPHGSDMTEWPEALRVRQWPGEEV